MTQGSGDEKRLVVADKNYHKRCLCCQVSNYIAHSDYESYNLVQIKSNEICSCWLSKITVVQQVLDIISSKDVSCLLTWTSFECRCKYHFGHVCETIPTRCLDIFSNFGYA